MAKYQVIISVDKEQLINYHNEIPKEERYEGFNVENIEEVVSNSFGCVEDAGIMLETLEKINGFAQYKAIVSVNEKQLMKYSQDFWGELEDIEDAFFHEFECLEEEGITLESVEVYK